MEFKYEKQAMRGEPCPERLDVADTCAYIALKHLYVMFRKGLITRQDATEEKRKIAFNYTKDKSMLEFLNREALKSSQTILDASEAYRKNPTIQNADKLYAAFYRLPENWREKEQ